MKKIVMSVLLTSLLAACASDKVKEPIAETRAPVSDAGNVNANTTAPQAVAVDPLNDPNSMLSKRSVFYPLDVSIVQDTDRPIIEAHAKYLSSNPGRNVRLEGNTDERGSNEYNLALGQRRADGVKQMLQAGGVRESQIEAISYGEEKPRATEHNESAWAQNRRTDLNYNAR